MESHLLQMRGLKPKLGSLTNGKIQSHLLQMRGLKPDRVTSLNTKKTSHLLQMRGLKQIYRYMQKQEERRIFYRCVD